MSDLPVIRYEKTEVNGIPLRPDSRSVMRKAVEGHAIEVTSEFDYINLYHVFERMTASDKTLAKLRLVRRQVGASTWRVFLVPKDVSAPAYLARENGRSLSRTPQSGCAGQSVVAVVEP